MEPQNSREKESCFKKWWWKNWYPLLHTIHKSQVKIDDRFKCFNFKEYKNLEENRRKQLLLWVKERFLRYNTKCMNP